MKITKRNLIKLIKENSKLLKENFDHLQVKEPFDRGNEVERARGFSITPPTVVITVKSLAGQINDNHIDVEITMSNGDRIDSDYKNIEIFSMSDRGDYQKYTFDCEKYHGSTRTVVGDVLLAYKDFITKIKK